MTYIIEKGKRLFITKLIYVKDFTGEKLLNIWEVSVTGAGLRNIEL